MEETQRTYKLGIGEKKWLVNFLLLSCLCLFAGRGFQHLFQDVPLRTLLWDQTLMEPFVNLVLNLSWTDYANDPKWDKAIQTIIKLMGAGYLICAAVCVSIYFNSSKYAKILLVGSFGLLLLSLLYFIEKFFRIGELLEYTAQWMSPVLLYLLVCRKATISTLNLCMRLAVAFTFAGHALYAVGFYPIPGTFLDMIIMTLHVEENTAITLLQCAGWMDLIVAIFILVPFFYRYAAFYAFIWGTLTAIARVWSNYDATLPFESLYQWLPETFVRIPHAIIPFAIFYVSVHFEKGFVLSNLWRRAENLYD